MDVGIDAQFVLIFHAERRYVVFDGAGFESHRVVNHEQVQIGEIHFFHCVLETFSHQFRHMMSIPHLAGDEKVAMMQMRSSHFVPDHLAQNVLIVIHPCRIEQSIAGSYCHLQAMHHHKSILTILF